MERTEINFDIRTNQETVITKTVPDEELLSMQRDVKNRQILQLKQNLAGTDYIANKLAEAIADFLVTGDNSKVYELKTQYAKQLQDRKSWRDEIDRLEKN